MNIAELIDEIYKLKAQKESLEDNISSLKHSIEEIDSIIENYRAELLFSMLQSDETLFYNNDSTVVAVKETKDKVTWKNESLILKYLSENSDYKKFIRTKITESIDKVNLKKEMKTNTELQENLKDSIIIEPSNTVMVIKKEDYERLLEEIKSSK